MSVFFEIYNNINLVYFLMVELILWENVKNIEFKIFVC